VGTNRHLWSCSNTRTAAETGENLKSMQERASGLRFEKHSTKKSSTLVLNQLYHDPKAAPEEQQIFNTV
jgi:hypothetical protein